MDAPPRAGRSFFVDPGFRTDPGRLDATRRTCARSTLMASVGTMRFRGDEGEELVARWLEGQGFRILTRNLRLGMLEVDIVAREGSMVALVEVRTRSKGALTSGFSSVGASKVLRLRRAGERLWSRYFRHDPTCSGLRFDLAAVTRTQSGAHVEYVRGAF